MKFVLSLLLILLGNCSLAENIQKEELKDYQDTVHNVELVDYEFEERLNSFYESEPIKNEDLFELYEGEFPEGERNPQKLRIHWKDARELALAELELQKHINSSWQNAEISERPILVLDKDGGDFYRYYEYRLIKNNKLLGAIRIAAYRRTENFATAEVHLYSDDEKTYTIHPTGWGQYMAENSNFVSSENFKKLIQSQIFPLIDDNVLYNFLYKMQQNNIPQTYSSLNKNVVYNLLSEFYISRFSDPNFHGKKKLSFDQFEYISKVGAAKDAEELANSITAGYQAVALAESTALLVDEMKNIWLSDFTDIYESSFVSFF